MIDLTRIAALEASGRAALPALHEETVDGWLLRVSGGDTKRVNSANPLDPDRPLAEARAAAERLYPTRGLPSRFRLTPLAHPEADRTLAAAGYSIADPSWTMVASLAPRDPDPALMLVERADPAAIVQAEVLSGRSPSAAAVQAKLLAALPGPLALASLVVEDELLATGYASVGAGRAQLSDIVVAPGARGQGLGRRLVAGLIGWAYDVGCREALLQVLASNDAARALYRSLGFADAYPYHYRVRR